MAHPLPRNATILGLDIGDARIGIARAHTIARLPEPLETIPNDQAMLQTLTEIVKRERADYIVVGVPRNLDGLETAQSAKIRRMAAVITTEVSLPVVFVDESLSSVRADNYLAATKKKKPAQDSVAACYILQEFFTLSDIGAL